MINRSITKLAEIIVDGRCTRPRELSKRGRDRIARRILHHGGYDVAASRKLVQSIRATHWWLTETEVLAKALRIRRRHPPLVTADLTRCELPPDVGNRRRGERP